VATDMADELPGFIPRGLSLDDVSLLRNYLRPVLAALEARSHSFCPWLHLLWTWTHARSRLRHVMEQREAGGAEQRPRSL
jgi:hypothetical protein